MIDAVKEFPGENVVRESEKLRHVIRVCIFFLFFCVLSIFSLFSLTGAADTKA